MLSVLQGADSQLQSHIGFSMNVGITASQLRQLVQVLADRVDAEAARRTKEALSAHLATTTDN
jgi:alkylhydroperoxidase/carboxymuconolactone decarboxylase family protein YurZ